MSTRRGPRFSSRGFLPASLPIFIQGQIRLHSRYHLNVSRSNWFGYKIPGDKSPTHPPGPNQCVDQSSHSATCGTSLSLMKRLMYTQLLYDSCYFAFEGEWTYDQGGGITPIGTLQQQAKKFFSSASSPELGTHVSTTAIMLDFFGGWTRPCDSRHGGYAAVAWGNLAWDGADYLADAVFDMVFPGYRGGAMNHDESYYLSPTPYGELKTDSKCYCASSRGCT